MVRRNSAFSLLALMFALLAGIPAGVGQSESPITTINDAVGLNRASDGDGSWYVTERVSVSSSETEANGLSRGPSISDDGRYVAFGSGASNLVPDDNNNWGDVFVRDRVSGVTELVSITSAGVQGYGGASWDPSISSDGRYVAFTSEARTLVAVLNFQADVFVHDRVSGVTEQVSVSSTGVLANNESYATSISGDGRYIAFHSFASNLVPGDTNGVDDVFVRDRVSGVTERVSVSSSDNEANSDSYMGSISGDGRYVTFSSDASNVVTGDDNEAIDVFVRDRTLGVTERVSVSSSGTEANNYSYVSSISDDGRYVAFHSAGSNLVADDTNGDADVFVHDRVSGVTERVTVSSSGVEANDYSSGESIGGDGRYVAFQSWASNLVADDTNGDADVFVHDRVLGTTHRVSVSSLGTEGNVWSVGPSITSDGRYVAFLSDSTNLVAGDTNETWDVFLAEFGVFADIADSVFEADIEWLADAGVTKGCNPPVNTMYCPDDYVTRGQMAAFLVRALDYTDSGAGDLFNDDDGSIFEADIDRLGTAGVTKGCNPPVNDMFCPNSHVTRGQMAAFLVRALGYTNDGGGDLFADDDDSIFETDIDRLATAGVTRGCNPPVNDEFCPTSNVTRGQMAAFLHRALG